MQILHKHSHDCQGVTHIIITTILVCANLMNALTEHTDAYPRTTNIFADPWIRPRLVRMCTELARIIKLSKPKRKGKNRHLQKFNCTAIQIYPVLYTILAVYVCLAIRCDKQRLYRKFHMAKRLTTPKVYGVAIQLYTEKATGTSEQDQTMLL